MDYAKNSAARVRELAKVEAPTGLDIAQLAHWYATQLGAVLYHAGVLAEAVDPQPAGDQS